MVCSHRVEIYGYLLMADRARFPCMPHTILDAGLPDTPHAIIDAGVIPISKD
jgi:hypothetical protein